MAIVLGKIETREDSNQGQQAQPVANKRQELEIPGTEQDKETGQHLAGYQKSEASE